MSSLIFTVEQDQVLIGTDTLATTLEGKHAFFTSKVFSLFTHGLLTRVMP